MIALSVNLNKVALLRNARPGHHPSVVDAARVAIAAGARGITVHPRPDQRHIRPEDVMALSALLRSDFPGIEFNIEGNPNAGPNPGGYPGFSELVTQAKPDQVTLVPDSDDQLTSDHGWDLSQKRPERARTIGLFQDLGARVSLFLDPEPALVDAAQAHGADRIELYTGPYAQAFWTQGIAGAQALLDQYVRTAQRAQELGVGVNAGHDLDQENLLPFRRLPGLLEVSIGHALICDALASGFAETVARYVRILDTED